LCDTAHQQGSSSMRQLNSIDDNTPSISALHIATCATAHVHCSAPCTPLECHAGQLQGA
jgi:hypothetical protein